MATIPPMAYRCTTCSSRATVVVHPTGEPCPAGPSCGLHDRPLPCLECAS